VAPSVAAKILIFVPRDAFCRAAANIGVIFFYRQLNMSPEHWWTPFVLFVMPSS
jgi:hypothetical protein